MTPREELAAIVARDSSICSCERCVAALGARTDADLFLTQAMVLDALEQRGYVLRGDDGPELNLVKYAERNPGGRPH